ncbi:thiolase family protein [Spirochaetota bacterium]
MRDAYIVSSVRTPGCRRNRGALAQTRPDDLIRFIVKAAVDNINLDPKYVDDFILGCAFPEAEQGLQLGRLAVQMAGFPDSVSGATINRWCASGLEGIVQSSMRIMAGWADVTMGGGVESMSIVPMGGNMPRPNVKFAKSNPEFYISMGVTAENVAKRYNVSREIQDEFSYHSQMKAVQAQKEGLFTEVVPTPAVKYVTQPDGSIKTEEFMQDFDDGVRDSTTIEGLSKLRPVFSSTGSVTAGNSSQTTDGAAATVIMSEEGLKKHNVKPIAKLVCYTTAGCKSDEMGIGPAIAIPKLLKIAGKKIEDVGLFEINEAFASQAVYCADELGIGDKKYWAYDSPDKKININGGAIALGHPLGCTGAKLCATLTTNMKRLGVKYGIESMCIGGGMGAAALFELCE